MRIANLRMMRGRVIKLTLAALLFQAIVAAIFVGAKLDGGIAAPSAPLRPNFRLQSSDGSVVDSRLLRGRPYLLFFGFASCPAMAAPKSPSSASVHAIRAKASASNAGRLEF